VLLPVSPLNEMSRREQTPGTVTAFVASWIFSSPASKPASDPFRDCEASRTQQPPLTTFRSPTYQIGFRGCGAVPRGIDPPGARPPLRCQGRRPEHPQAERGRAGASAPHHDDCSALGPFHRGMPAQVGGFCVALLAARAVRVMTIVEFAPSSIKQAVAGSGRASKDQVADVGSVDLDRQTQERPKRLRCRRLPQADWESLRHFLDAARFLLRY